MILLHLSLSLCLSLSGIGNSLCFLWTQKARGAPVLERTLGYNIQYFPENSTSLTEINNVTNQQYELLLTSQSYRVSVTSFNSRGKSQEAVLRIPAVDEDSKYLFLRCLVPSGWRRSSPCPWGSCSSGIKLKGWGTRTLWGNRIC